jgi:hypothetical protein
MLRRSRGWDLDRFLPQSCGQLRSILPGAVRVSHGLGRRSVTVVWMLAGPDAVRATTLIQATACAASRTLTGRTQHHYMRLRFRSWSVTWQFPEDPPEKRPGEGGAESSC